MCPYFDAIQLVKSRNERLQKYAHHKSNGSIYAAQGPPVDCTRMLCIVPQSMYTVMQSGASDDTATILPVVFSVHREIGVKLADVYQHAQDNLVHPDGEVRLGDKSKITHRIRIDGASSYTCDRVVAACRGTPQQPQLLSRRKVAHHIAVTVKECMENYGGSWVLKDGKRVEYEDIVLLSLHRVSEGSWQPLLAFYYNDPVA